jgi:hypothetical protein
VPPLLTSIANGVTTAGTVATFVPNQSFIHGERIQVVLTDSVSEDLFARGLCLPSGSCLLNSDLERICGLQICVKDSAGVSHL